MRRALTSLCITSAAVLVLSSFLPGSAEAAVPFVRTVPWVAGQPAIPHETYPGKSITLKGTTSFAAHFFYAKWRFGDGTPDALFIVSDSFDVSTTHTYVGPAGKRWTATLTIIDADSGDTASAEYNVVMREDNLATRVNVAIDEGLWYLHRTLQRSSPGVSALADWDNLAPSPCNAGDQACDNLNDSPAINASNVLAFELNGHLENGPESNPYAEDVRRVLARMFTHMRAVAIPRRGTCPGNSCSFDPDGNGNGLAVFVQSAGKPNAPDPTGQFIDAIVASGTPDTKVMTGPENISGRTYKEIVQDLIDGYSYCRFSATPEGPCPKGIAHSAVGLAKAGLPAAMKAFGIVVPPVVTQADQAQLSSQMPAPAADRYAAEISKGAPSEPIVRSLVSTQNPVGFWNGRADAASDRPFETAWSIIMLRRGSLRNQ